MSDETLRNSPLHDEHQALGARLVGFAGWNMPVQYAGILPEHQAVRSGCGVFDISHMGQLLVEGAEATAWLDQQLTNHVGALENGEAHYTFLLNETGGVIDDLILYRLAESRFLLIVNASKVDEDEGWLRDHLGGEVQLSNVSDCYAGMAIQGPGTMDIAKGLWPTGFDLPERNRVATLETDAGEAYVCRTGYTGEDGFELFLPQALAADHWKRLLEQGVTPCGLGARDTLRLEMGYPLNGNDLSAERTPLEAGLGFFVSLKKESFVGSDRLRQQKADGLTHRLVGLAMTGKGPPLRAGYEVFHEDRSLGLLTSGCLSPSLGHRIGMAYLPVADAKIGSAHEVEIRGRRFPVTIVKKPFYRPKA